VSLIQQTLQVYDERELEVRTACLAPSYTNLNAENQNFHSTFIASVFGPRLLVGTGQNLKLRICFNPVLLLVIQPTVK
jgi:hypothetical protein